MLDSCIEASQTRLRPFITNPNQRTQPTDAAPEPPAIL